MSKAIEWVTELLSDRLTRKSDMHVNAITKGTTQKYQLPSIKDNLQQKEKDTIAAEFKNAPKDTTLKGVKTKAG